MYTGIAWFWHSIYWMVNILECIIGSYCYQTTPAKELHNDIWTVKKIPNLYAMGEWAIYLGLEVQSFIVTVNLTIRISRINSHKTCLIDKRCPDEMAWWCICGRYCSINCFSVAQDTYRLLLKYYISSIIKPLVPRLYLSPMGPLLAATVYRPCVKTTDTAFFHPFGCCNCMYIVYHLCIS